MVVWLPKDKNEWTLALFLDCGDFLLFSGDSVTHLVTITKEENMNKGVVRLVQVVKGMLAVLVLCLGLGQVSSVQAATAAQKESYKQELLSMFKNYDYTQHNVYQYRIPYTEFNQLYDEVQYGEGAEIFGAFYPTMNTYYTYYTSSGYLSTSQIKNANTDAPERYEAMLPQIELMLEGIEDDMNDLDKVIYLHDAVVERTVYGGNTDAKYVASGVFLEKKAVCAGYAKALNILLRRVGIDTTYVKGTSLNHGWSYVKLNGEWYHVDPTWDDTRSPKSGQTSRKFLLLNDETMGIDHGEWLVKRIDMSSDSNTYQNLAVRDIVGAMYFEDGLWYYLDSTNKKVMSYSTQSNLCEEVFSYGDMGTVKLVDATEEGLILTVNGSQYTKTVEAWEKYAEELTNKDQLTDNNVQEDLSAEGSLDLSDISMWRTGHFNPSSGTYAPNKFRICLLDVIEKTQDTYVICISNPDFRMAIRELNDRKKMITSVDLGNGDIYVPGEGTEYLAISLYNSVQEKGNFFSVYEEMFANGFKVSLGTSLQEDVVEDTTIATPDTGNSVEDETEIDKNEGAVGWVYDLSDISLWRTGHFNPYTGTYGSNKFRICLLEVIGNTQDSYEIRISNPDFRMAIRELNSRKKMITSVDLSDGDVYVPGEGTEYLAISLYNSVQEKGTFFSVYEEMFANGFQVALGVAKAEENDSVADDDAGTTEEEDTLTEALPAEKEQIQEEDVLLGDSAEGPELDEAAQEVPTQTLRELLYTMLVTGDTSRHDVSAYNVKMTDVDAAWNAMIAQEGYIAFEARANLIIQTTKDSQGKILTLWLYDLAGGDFFAKYEKVLNCVAEVKAATIGMTETEKVLYVYEYVMSHTAYSQNGYQTAYAGGALGEGRAKCEGYARTCMLLLRQIGVECYRVTSSDMNHSWTYVKVDGEWYHLDATWDDTSGGTHTYLLRNSQEYDTMEGRHYSWKLVNGDGVPDSTSERFSDWFVHNVKGAMYYEAGIWYYVDNATGSVVRSDIWGNGYEVLVENTGKGLVLTGVKDGQVSYYAK